MARRRSKSEQSVSEARPLGRALVSTPAVAGGQNNQRGLNGKIETQFNQPSRLRQTSARGRRRRIDGGKSAVEGDRANADTNASAFAATVADTRAHHERHDAQRREANRP